MASEKNGHNGTYDRKTTPNGTANNRFDQLPPQSLQAEKGVLGSVLYDNVRMHDVASLLKVEDFYRERHQIIYRVIREIYERGQPFDSLILKEELETRGLLEQAGGDDEIAELLASVPHAANAEYYARIVREKSVRRQLVESANQILYDGYGQTKTSEQMLQDAERQIFQIAEEQAIGETIDIATLLETAMERIVHRAEHRQVVAGLGSGYFELDDLTTGFHPAQLIILAARPSMGKTALALNICESVAVEQRVGVLFVSLEMGQNELADRLLVARARVDGYKVRTGQNLGNRELNKLSEGYDELRQAPLFIDDTPTRNMLQITANARRLKLRHNLGMVVVDYIQLIEPESGDHRDSRQEQISKISRRLKALARELQVPVISLSQLNRAVESREDRRPRMADLRESGAIEQDADIVMLLHRPEYYDANDQPGIGELIVAKNRNGATGTVKMTFLKSFMRFENLANVEEPFQ